MGDYLFDHLAQISVDFLLIIPVNPRDKIGAFANVGLIFFAPFDPFVILVESVARKWSRLGVAAGYLLSFPLPGREMRAMAPGRYIPDASEGITRVEDLPQ